MSPVIAFALIVGAFLFSVLFTGYVRGYARRHAIMDVPNDRSLHSSPTPRGGGISIAVSWLGACVILYGINLLDLRSVLALAGGGLLVAVVGWRDDRRHIAAGWRALAYLLASAWGVYWAADPELAAWPLTAGSVCAALAIAWLVNLYNFMDGTDALAAVQAICTGVMGGLLLRHAGQPGLSLLCFVVAFSSAGFLCWNWPPAKIFMGDSGSCLLGYSFGVLAFLGAAAGISLAVWYILLAVFVCDASLTLFMRVVKGEKFYSAHRSHAYQRIVQMGYSHATVAYGALLINIMILWPAAYTAYRHEAWSLPLAAVVTLIMCLLWGGIQWSFHRQIRT